MPFADAVAAICGKDVEAVEATLLRNGISADPSPPGARPLRLSSVRFSGVKTLFDQRESFEFEWTDLNDGLWGIASEENLVGKSSFVQIVLWALRGTPKSLSPAVRSWLSHVEVTFLVDGRAVDVVFDVADGVPSGHVRIAGESKPQTFSGDESFKRVMQAVMMRPLGLEPVASAIEKDGVVTRYEDGWPAFTGAFLSDTRSDAIIGENIGVNVTQKLLAVFLGLPWASTQYQARASKKTLESEIAQQKRKMASLGGRNVTQMEVELADIKRQIADEESRETNAAQFMAAQSELENMSDRSVAARTRLTDMQSLLSETKEARVCAERSLLDINEEHRANVFFQQLDPVQCPRCSTGITHERKSLEEASRACAVCTTVVEPPTPEEEVAEKAEAERAVRRAKQRQTSAQEAVTDAQRRLEEIMLERTVIAKRLAELGRLGTVADVQVLQRRADRVEGMLDIARAVTGTAEEEDDALKIVSAALTEADRRVSDAASDVLARVSEEITRLASAFGIRSLESVAIGRNANVTLRAGGVPTPFSQLATGEQLRLRIATVIALVKIAKEHGAGRHPGLLFIDSPRTDEMTDENFGELMSELAKAVDEIEDIQFFVTATGIDAVKVSISPEKLRIVPAGMFLW